MRLIVNGETIELEVHTLADVLTQRNIEAPVATAVNQTFVAINERVNTPLKDGDQIEILSPMQGG